MTQRATHELAVAAPAKRSATKRSFSHEALLYSGDEGFLQGTRPFVAEGLLAGEAVLVAVARKRLDLLRRALGEDRECVRFLDIRELGRNPARMIPAWLRFLAEGAEEGRSVRVVGEPVWPGRSPAELEECERSDALLDEAFAERPPLLLLCAYDIDALGAETIRAARATHPSMTPEGPLQHEHPAANEGPDAGNGAEQARRRSRGPFDGRLPDPPADRVELAFAAGGLGAIRRLVAEHGSRAGLSESSREDLVLAVNELVTNSVQYGGGEGSLTIWHDREALLCEVRDRGLIRDRLVGRLPPPVEQYGGRGLWLANHLCDLVQIRSGTEGTVVRVHMRSDREPWPA
jgi:anti-sigma regulatory factor (Ser/Thr protein kinase)